MKAKKSGARAPHKKTISAPAIALIVEEPLWRKDAQGLRLIRRAARSALVTSAALTILLSNDKRLQALNVQFRGKDKPTNVLSFPAADGPLYLGDVAISHGAVRREARAQKKTFSAHAAHLAVHGILHLRGYDHEKVKDARVMEALETAILAKLGIADPYASISIRRAENR